MLPHRGVKMPWGDELDVLKMLCDLYFRKPIDSCPISLINKLSYVSIGLVKVN